MDTDKQLQELRRELSAARQEQRDGNGWTIFAVIFVGGGGLGMLAGLPWADIILCAITIGVLVLLGCVIRDVCRAIYRLANPTRHMNTSKRS